MGRVELVGIRSKGLLQPSNMKSVCAILLCLVAAAAASYVFPSYAGAFAHYPAYPYYYGNYFGYGGYGGAYNRFNGYRVGVNHPSYRVGVQYYFLGTYSGSCANNYNYGFYSAGADNADSFVVCDHGRSFRFQCPAGTKNGGTFSYNAAYTMGDLCSQHTNQ